MIANAVLVLSAIIGNIIYVNYVPKTYIAEICLNTNKSDNFEYCETMKIANVNGSTMWYHQLHNKYTSSIHYFKIKYIYPNKTIINSEWRVLTQQNQFHCDNLSYSHYLYVTLLCFALIYVMYFSILLFLWKIYKFLH